MLNAMAISILSEDVWDKPDIEFDRMEEFQEQITEDRVTVKHLARKAHVVTHQNWIGDYYRHLVRDGSTLLSYGKFIYPNVVFCAENPFPN